MILANTKTRILEYLESKGIKIPEFYAKTGLKRGLLDKDKLDATVSDVVLAKILVAFPELNPDWLITGEGDMYRNPDENSADESASLRRLLESQQETIRDLTSIIKKGSAPQDAAASSAAAATTALSAE